MIANTIKSTELIKMNWKYFVFIGFLVSPKLNIFSQERIKSKAIFSEGVNYSLHHNVNQYYYDLRVTDPTKTIKDFTTPIIVDKNSMSQPIPWFLKNDLFYYVSTNFFFKGDITLKISAVYIDEITKPLTKHPSVAARELDLNSKEDYFISQLHNRKFNASQLKDVQYDFILTKKQDVLLVSHFEKSTCIYVADFSKNELEFCGCQESSINIPFQLSLSKEGTIIIIDNTSETFEIKKLISNEYLIQESDVDINNFYDQNGVLTLINK